MTVGTLFDDFLGLFKHIKKKKKKAKHPNHPVILGTSYGKHLAINVSVIIQTF